jgi:single-strand DNA-binding protein
MSSSVNRVILVGRLGKDPEVRFTQGGKAVANLSIATDESYKNNDGEKVKKTEWHSIVVWGNSVENFVQKYLHKGDMVYVEGKLQTRTWDDKDGNKKYTTEINVTDIKGLITGTADESAPQNTRTTQNKPAAKPAARQQVDPTPTVDDDDLAF